MPNLLTTLARLFTGHRPAATTPADHDRTPPWEHTQRQRQPARRPPAPPRSLPARIDDHQSLPVRITDPQSLPARTTGPWTAGPRPTAARLPDRIGLVGFHEYGFVIARPAEPFAPWLVERSRTLHNQLGGRTNLADGLRQALQLLSTAPPVYYRKIWLLSDGEPNVDVSSIGPLIAACHQSRININAIGFGDAYDELTLRRIAGATHRGKFVPVQGLRELTRALADSDLPAAATNRRPETAVLVIDCSASMAEPMEGRSKIAVVEEAILHLLHYKQRLFS